MEEIAFKEWHLSASMVDADVLKLDIEALDGTDIIEVGYASHGVGRGGEEYTLHLSTERIEDVHNRPLRGSNGVEPVEGDGEPDAARGEWPIDEADEDETLYVRGWEVTAFVDEEGMLNADVQKGEDNEIYEVEPIESGVPLSSRVIIRLAARELVDEGDDEDEDDDGYDDELDDYEDLDEADETDSLDDPYDDVEEDDYDEVGSLSPYDDLFERRRGDDWY